jgi:hypothetical protein
MKVGDLVRLKDMPYDDLGIIIKINQKFNWADVWWCGMSDCWAFFQEDLEIVSKKR